MEEHGSQGLLAYAIARGVVQTAMASGFPLQCHDRLTDTPQMVADTLVFLTKERREWLASRYRFALGHGGAAGEERRDH